MCGIAGVVSTEAKPELSAVLKRMSELIRYRGPDALGFYQDEHCGLVHVRLSIIDLANGAQPMASADGSLQMTFNGEIFNYLELRQELVAKGYKFSTCSDTEVLLRLYEDMGPACVDCMNGQWAFAIWDSRHRKLFLSRDRFGVRPLFYTFVGNSFVFASEVKALFAYPGVPRELDLEALNQIFTFWHTIPPRTAFRGVCELPPGCSAVLSDGRLAIARYWNLEYTVSPSNSRVGDDEETYSEELLSLLTDAVRVRLRADVPVGAYLSGGLDSSVVTGLVRQAGIADLRTFSVRFHDADLDEGPYQQDVVRRLGTRHEDIQCSNQSIGEAFPSALWHIEKPVLRTAPVPLFLLSGLVRKSGFKVVLTGEGADEILGGYDIFKEVKIRSFWAKQPGSAYRPLLLRKLYPYMSQLQSQSPAYLRAFFHINPADTGSAFFSHLTRWRLTSKLKAFFSEAVKDELKQADPMEELAALLPPYYEQWSPFTRAQFLESQYLLPGYILSSQGDRMAMAHSVEGRFPFLDYRIAEFAGRLPARMKMRGLNEKFLLKRAAANLVPASVLRRPKQPYRAPDARSFFSGGQTEYVRELLSREQVARDGVFNPAAVGLLADKAARGGMTGVADNMALVGILSTQLLIHQFISAFPASPGAC